MGEGQCDGLSCPQACKEKGLGKLDLEEEATKRQCKFYIPNWFSVEIKTGVSRMC